MECKEICFNKKFEETHKIKIKEIKISHSYVFLVKNNENIYFLEIIEISLIIFF